MYIWQDINGKIDVTLRTRLKERISLTTVIKSVNIICGISSGSFVAGITAVLCALMNLNGFNKHSAVGIPMSGNNQQPKGESELFTSLAIQPINRKAKCDCQRA